jgi:acyl-coenzyme A synthetase/AMP-(fatty) acid ligase
VAVVDSLFAHARGTPDKAALIHNGRAVSYLEFAARIAEMRRLLEAADIRRDRVAVLCIGVLPDVWIIGLALRSLGVTTVCGRSTSDIDRLGLGQVTVISTVAESWPGLAAAAERAGRPLILAPSSVGAAALRVASDPPPQVEPGGHILLTSGTTGAYKKVLVSPGREAGNVATRAEVLGVSGRSVMALFDFGGWTAYGYQWPVCVWTLGGTVAFHQGPERWRGLAAPGLTHIMGHPQLLADLLDAPAEAVLRNDDAMLLVGAGVLSLAQWRAARERITHDVRALVGSTEAGNFTLTRIETPEDLAWHRVLPSCQLQVVDDDDQVLPAGRTGVVRVRTTGVEAYLDDPETSRAFFRGGWFYPGDLGMLRDDGRLSLRGRVTDVINVMGDKLAATPIETALRDALGARDVCVFSAAGEDGEAVHVAVQPGRAVTPDALRAALAAALPGVAEVLVHTVRDFPRNHMGKIERVALKAQLLPGRAGAA